MAAVINHHVTVTDENEGPVVNIAAVSFSSIPLFCPRRPFHIFQIFWLQFESIRNMGGTDLPNYQWLGMTLAVLFVLIRIGSKWSVLRKWHADDTMIITTMVGVHFSWKTSDSSISGACDNTYYRNLDNGRQWPRATPGCS